MLSLKTKITFSFALLIFMLIVAGLMSLSEFKKVSSSADQIIKKQYASIEQSKSILESLEHENTGLLMFLAGNMEEGMKIISESDSTIQKIIAETTASAIEKEEKDYLLTIDEEYQKFHSSALTACRKANSIPLDERNKLYLTEIHPLFSSVKSAVDVFVKHNQENIISQASFVSQRSKRAIMPALVSIIAAILFSIILNFFINEYFVSPIKKITEAVSSFYPEQYNLNIKINSKDEIKELEKEINKMILRLQRSRSQNE
jgi:HAMP domain-containing protein